MKLYQVILTPEAQADLLGVKVGVGGALQEQFCTRQLCSQSCHSVLSFFV
ncbi:MAG: hypothetical protein HND45_13725 [Chloroflexi bacterium]|jgi:hypothetical protein|nr:hypothetical protein [Anaerolineales bacterium]NOG76943.1 hypothetical protein [Chloroflexota bacterium]WKZ50689.1 MAG: hypothetical protein QY329_14610 [Anaerolineales bacterium]WKZ53575.1 MAG: hypothetical protein QY324_12145 [Anaerolineales bacterium]GIK11213.1 MAG: hypothetical protein BroJett001_32790 [Chloroflexota bacterium]